MPRSFHIGTRTGPIKPESVRPVTLFGRENLYGRLLFQIIDILFDRMLSLGLLEVGFDISLCIMTRRQCAILSTRRENMISIPRLNHLADLTRLKEFRCLLEFRDHPPLFEETEVASLFLAWT